MVMLSIIVTVHGAGLQWLNVDFRPEAFILETDPMFKAREAYQQRWSASDLPISVVVSSPNQDLLKPEGRAHVRAIQWALRTNPAVKDVYSYLDAPMVWLNAEGTIHQESMEVFLQHQHPSPTAHTLSSRAPAAFNVEDIPLLASDGLSTLMIMTLNPPPIPVHQLPETLDSIRTTLTQTGERSDVTIDFIGVTALRAHFYTQTISEQRLFLSLSLVFMLAVLFLFYRQLLCVLIFGICAFAALVLFSGFMGLAGISVGLINQVLFTLIPAFTLANAIHLFNHLQHALRTRGHSREPTVEEWREQITQTMHVILPVCTGTLITTACAFLSLLYAKVPPVREFGVLAAMGMLYVFLSLSFLFPLLLSTSVIRRRLWKRSHAQAQQHNTAQGQEPASSLWLLSMYGVLAKPRHLVLALTLGFGAAFVIVSQLDVDHELSSLLPQDSQMRKTIATVDDFLGGSVRLGVEITPFSLNDASPDDFQRLENFSLALKDVPQIRSVTSGLEPFKRMHALFTDDENLPTTRSQIQQYSFLLDDSLTQVFFQQKSCRLLIGVEDSGGQAMLDTIAQIKAIGTHHFGTSATIHVHGPIADAFARLSHLVGELLWGFLIALCVVLAVMGLILRDVKLVLISLVPNLFPMMAALIVLVLCHWPLDVGPAVLCTIAFGIAVDDTLHILVNYQRMRQHTSPLESIHIVLQKTGYAIFISSCVIGIGFLVQGLSSFASIHRIGVLGAVIMIGAIIGDLLILPALLVFASQRKNQRDEAC